MNLEIDYRLPLRSALIPVATEGQGTSKREALTSVLSAICANNALSIKSVLKHLPFSPSSSYIKQVSSEYPVYVANFGGKVTSEVSRIFEQATGLRDLNQHSLFAWNSGNPSAPIIALDKFKKWCPACYADSVAADCRPYVQLCWLIQGVEICPVHCTKLETHCSNCGNGDFSFLRNHDVAGFCPKCLAWLGEHPRHLPTVGDENLQYQWWVARCVSELFDFEHGSEPNYHDNIASILEALLELHFDGNGTHAGKHLGRSKSQLSQWRNGVVTPKWDAICQISYAFQVPIRAIFHADKDAIQFSCLTNLPSATKFSKSRPKVRKEHDWASITSFMDDVRRGKHPSIQRIKHIAERFGIDYTVLGKKLPDETRILRELLAQRRKVATEHKRAAREIMLQRALHIATKAMTDSRIKITRRNLTETLFLQGISLRRTEFRSALSIANAIANEQSKEQT